MSHKIIIPNTHPHHQRLTDVINSFAGKKNVLRVFLSYSKNSQKHLLIIHITDMHVPAEVQKSKWITKAMEQYDTHILIMGEQNVRVHLRFGSLYINWHCNASTFIYKKEDHEFTYHELPEQLKKFKQFKEEYYHTHDLFDTEIRKAKNNNSLSLAYHLYLPIFEHHIHYLEILFIGDYFSRGSISERIMRLEQFLPEVKAMMLKKTENTYFLIEALSSAKKADEHEDYMYVKDEFEDAIIQTERKFYNLVQDVFHEIKKEVKKPKNKPILIENKTISHYEPVIKILTKHFRIEEIFLFNEQEVYSADQKTTVLYLLLISNKISNQNLFEMMQMVAQQTEARFNIVPIAHSKASIQEKLFLNQDFYKKVIIPENSIFRADVPAIMHWIAIDANGDTDEGIYYRLCSELHDNYKLLRSQEDQTSNEGVGLMLSGFFYRACVIFIYVTLRYHPNQINIRILWKLCEYVDPNVKNLDYLIQKLPFDFFEFLNPSKNLYRNFHFLNQQHLNILDELAQGFLDLVDKQFDK